MTFDPQSHHRRSIRLKGWDYGTPGAYSITMCTQNKECLFGRMIAGVMQLNDAGQMIERWWNELGRKFSSVRTDAIVVMPNHVHGILFLLDARGAHAGAPLPEIARWFKTMTTNEYMRGVKKSGWPRLEGKLWQRNYYEHIIRNNPQR